MSGNPDSALEEDYVTCPAPACNRQGRKSAIRTHLAERDDDRHAL